MDSTGENWKIQVPEPTALLLRDKGYTCVPRGEINVKGKGIMFTYWVLGKNESVSRLTSPTIGPGGVPSTTTPSSMSLQRQTSNHSSLAAVVFGIMQATKRNTPSTRKFFPSSTFAIFFAFSSFIVTINNLSCSISFFCSSTILALSLSRSPFCLIKANIGDETTFHSANENESNKRNEIYCAMLGFPLWQLSFRPALMKNMTQCSEETSA